MDALVGGGVVKKIAKSPERQAELDALVAKNDAMQAEYNTLRHGRMLAAEAVMEEILALWPKIEELWGSTDWSA